MAIQYQALAVPLVGDRRVSVDQYLGSIFDGSAKLQERMTQEFRDCPDSKVIIVGYSQGALAAHLNLYDGVNDDDRIVGVVMIADPSRVSNAQEEWWASASFSGTQIERLVAPDSAHKASEGSWTVLKTIIGASGTSSLAPAVADKTIGICHPRDPVCSARPNVSMSEHENYSSSELTAIGYRLAARILYGS